MKPRIWISEINFNDSTKIEISKNDIILFVGPNNVGKSVALSDIYNKLRKKTHRGVVVKDIEIEQEADETVLVSYLEGKSITNDTNEALKQFSTYKVNANENQIKQGWKNYKNGLDQLFQFFINHLNTIQRLSAVNSPPNISLVSQAPTHPIHFLQRDDSLEKQFSDYFKSAFGQELIVHRNAGNKVPIHIGERPTLEEGEDRVSLSYIKKIEQLPTLETQGDGMKSFMGVLLNAFAADHSIVLIDEPEAFLHPPQARLLGKMIGSDLPRDRQLLLASHSGDFLRGLLDSNSQNIRIIRIRRQGSNNYLCELKPTEIEEIWKDPILRHSNVLDGIFHTKVILCESDSDCRFYSALLTAMFDASSDVRPDTMFIHCGGKHRMPLVISALRKLDVPVSVICDFDILNNESPLSKVVTELGGDWEAIKGKWRLVKQSIDNKKPELESSDVKEKIEAILKDITDTKFPKDKAKEINKVLKKISAWSHAKEVGKAFVPSGDPTNSYNEIIKEFIQIGLHVVEVGELECFAKSVGNHGPKWVNNVLSKDLINDSELETARKFIEQIIK